MWKFFECFGNWNVPPNSDKELAKADVVLTHGFGEEGKIDFASEMIVMRGLRLARAFGKPLICQHPGDIIVAQTTFKPLYILNKHLVRPDTYIDTEEEVNRQAADECRKREFKTVLLVAHPHHIWRAGQNLKTHGMQVLYAPNADLPYDSKSSRWWLRTPWLFIPREVLVRLLYLKKSWI
jgi:hypothetical protein